MFRAILRNSYADVKALIESGEDVNQVFSTSGSRPIHFACSLGRTELVALLIESGADVHTKTEKGKTPFAIACRMGRCETVELLLQHGVDPNIGYPLGDAIYFNRVEVVRKLLKIGVKVQQSGRLCPPKIKSLLNRLKLIHLVTILPGDLVLHVAGYM